MSPQNNFWCYLFIYTQHFPTESYLSKSYHLLIPKGGQEDTYPASSAGVMLTDSDRM